MYGCNGGGCAEFFVKYLKSEVSKQVRRHQSLQPGDSKTSSSQVPVDTKTLSQVPGDAKTSSSLMTSTDNSVAHTALVSIFPSSTHDLSLPSPSDLLAQLKVTLTVCIQASVL